MAAFNEHGSGLRPPLTAALQEVDVQLDALIYDAFPLKKAGQKT